jgi:uncharacterized protein
LAKVARNGVLVDAGPLVAILSERDQHHAACLAEAKSLRGPFYTSWPVVTEAAYLLRDRPEAVRKLLARIQSAKLVVLPIDPAELESIADILTRYRDQGFDFADATLMHLAVREGVDSVFTVDKRHFSVYRTPNGLALNVRP